MTTTTAPPTTTAVAKIDPNRPPVTAQDVRRFLESPSSLSMIQKVAGSMDPRRCVAILCAAGSRNPTLAKCTPLSQLRTLMQGAELGLEVAGGLQEFHAVPYWNSDLKCYEAQGIPGYKGLIKLVKQGGEVSRVTCEPVYKGDAFDYQLGDDPYLRHKPDLATLGEDRPDADILAFYAVAFFKDGTSQFEVMGRAAVDKIKARALEKKKNAAFSPWATDYSEMGRKTALRRLSKRLPMTSALAKALDLQAAAEAGDFLTHDVPLAPVVEGEVHPHPAAAAGPDSAAGASNTASNPDPVDQVDFTYGSTLTEKQIGTAKGHADRLGLDHTSARRVISAVSRGEKAPARAWMDLMFSKDDAKIRFAFENHPDWVAPPVEGPLPGAAIPEADSTAPASGSGPSDDFPWPDEEH